MHPVNAAHPRPGTGTSVPRRAVLRAGLGAGAALAAAALLPTSAWAADEDWRNTRSGQYDRAAAVAWAYSNVDSDPVFQNDCAYFCSRSLWHGNLPQTREWTNYCDITDPDLAASKADLIPRLPYTDAPVPTKYATDADLLFTYLSSSGLGHVSKLSFGDNNVAGAEIGDLIFYSWNDHDVENLVMDHAMIITSFSNDSTADYRYAQMSGHSEKRVDQGWTWSGARNGWIADVYRDSSGSEPTAWLMHITY